MKDEALHSVPKCIFNILNQQRFNIQSKISWCRKAYVERMANRSDILPSHRRAILKRKLDRPRNWFNPVLPRFLSKSAPFLAKIAPFLTKFGPKLFMPYLPRKPSTAPIFAKYAPKLSKYQIWPEIDCCTRSAPICRKLGFPGNQSVFFTWI